MRSVSDSSWKLSQPWLVATHLHKRKCPSHSWTLSDALRQSPATSEIETATQSWPLLDALRISDFHAHVRHFAADFATTALASCYTGSTSTLPTKTEIARIERAFYPFELYCKLFPSSHTPRRARKHHEIFFSKFSAWENEQLACVHDYLVKTVFPGDCDVP